MNIETEKAEKDQLRVTINDNSFDFPQCGRIGSQKLYATPDHRKLTEGDMVVLCHKLPRWFKRIARNQAEGYAMLKDISRAYSNVKVIG